MELTPNSDEINYKFTFLLAVVSLLGPLYALAVGAVKPVLFSFTMSIICFLFSILQFTFARDEKYRFYLRVALVVALGTAMPAFYTGVGPVVRSRNLPLNDEALLRIDAFLLGKFFPDGQLALAVDQNTFIGPTTIIGRLLTEILQLSYVSYYVWGYFLLLAFLGQYIYAHWKSDKIGKDKNWNHVKMFLCAWLGTCILNFVINLLVPAVSPRLFIADRFEKPLDGFGLAAIFRRAIYVAGEGSYGTFPSAHTSVSWVTGLVAIKFFFLFGRATLSAAVLITIATVYLRYHYVIDLIGAIPLVIFGLIYGGYVSYSEFESWVISQFFFVWSFPSFLISRLAAYFPLPFLGNLEVSYSSSFSFNNLKQKRISCTV